MKQEKRKIRDLWIAIAVMLLSMIPTNAFGAEFKSMMNITEQTAVSLYKYDLVALMKKTPNKTGTWVKTSKGYRFKLTTNQYLKNGWARIGGRIYCFDENGYRRVGFYTYRNRKYYFKSNGQLAVNYWLTNGLRKCYLKPDGTLTIGWLQYGGKYYYFSERGLMVRGWRLINGQLYYFRQDGTRVSGWEYITDSSDQQTYRHYFNSEGMPVTGWAIIDGKQYYLSERGRVTVGWKQVRDEYWYYFEEDGSGANGWKNISGSWYYFTQGIMVVNQWKDGYYLGSDGKRQTGDYDDAIYIFCGDSRTVLMGQAINNPADAYVAKSKQGYLWFRSTGFGELQNYLTKNPKAKVILNFGVNDLVNCSKYISFYQELFQMYPMARFYIVSVNPVDDENYPYLIDHGKSTEEIEAFNRQMKAAFPTRYIDTYTYLQQNGFETEDGVHYSTKTYQDIYNYIKQKTK